VRKVVFTGSTEVGKHIMAGCAEQVKRVTLELGGKSANIVFADADLERAAATAPYGVFENAGQDCCARSRILVERSVYERFMELLEPAVHGVKVGDPADETTEMGPLVARQHLERVRSFVPDDADVAFRGSAPTGAGFWFAPTVLTPSRESRAAREEIFGPVVSVFPFDDEADAITFANASEYGLSGSIWTRDLSRGIRVARAVESGNLSVNSHSSVRYATPFGGFKQSGSAASSDPMRRSPSPRRRTSSSPSTDRPKPYDRSTMTDLARIDLTTAARRDASPSSPAGQRHRLATASASPPRARRCDRRLSTGRRQRGRARSADVRAGRTSPTRRRSTTLRHGRRTYGSVDIAFNKRASHRPTTTRSRRPRCRRGRRCRT
jgi:delta 1-pyrroline-5-carboxylate dehydrogenase